jgi:cyclin-dependent kinase 12/13
VKPKKSYRRRIREEYGAFLPERALDLMDRMLTLDPEKRCSADESLSSPWLRNLNVDRSVTDEGGRKKSCGTFTLVLSVKIG